MATHPDATLPTIAEIETLLHALDHYETAAQYEANHMGFNKARAARLDGIDKARQRVTRLLRFAHSSR